MSKSRAELAKASAISILQQLRVRGHSAYLVGGCVRDLLIGIAPQDYDIATSARPNEVMALFPDTIPVGAQFGVVLVVMRQTDEKPIHVEVATYRSDVGFTDG